MTGFPNAFAWRAACAADAVLATWAGPWAVCFAIKSGSDATVFDFVEAQVAADPGTAAFTLAAPKTTWSRFLEPVPPRHHHGIFAMMYRLPEFSIQGDELVFMQHAHIARRVLAGDGPTISRCLSFRAPARPIQLGRCRRERLPPWNR